MTEALKDRAVDAATDYVVDRPVTGGSDGYAHHHHGPQPLDWPVETPADVYDDREPLGDEFEVPSSVSGGEVGRYAEESQQGGIVRKSLGKVATRFLKRGEGYEKLAKARRDIPGALHQHEGADAAPPIDAPPRDYRRWERARRKDAKNTLRHNDIIQDRHVLIDRSHSTQGLRSGKMVRNRITWQKRQNALAEAASQEPSYGFIFTKDGRKVPTIFTPTYQEPLLDQDDHLPKEEQARIAAENKRIKAENKARLKTTAGRHEKLGKLVKGLDPDKPIDVNNPLDVRSVPINNEAATLTSDEAAEVETVMMNSVNPDLKRQVDAGVLTRAEAKKKASEIRGVIENRLLVTRSMKPDIEKKVKKEVDDDIRAGTVAPADAEKEVKKRTNKAIKQELRQSRRKKTKAGKKIRDDREKVEQIKYWMGRAAEDYEETSNPSPIPDLDNPDQAIDRINNRTPNWGGNRANEAKQLRKWMRLNRESHRIRERQEAVSEGRDWTGRRFKRQSKRRRNAASKIVGAQKNSARARTRIGETSEQVKDKARYKAQRASIKALGKATEASRKVRGKFGEMAHKIHMRDYDNTKLSKKAEELRTRSYRDARLKVRADNLWLKDYGDTRLARLGRKKPKLQKVADKQRQFGEFRAKKLDKLADRQEQFGRFRGKQVKKAAKGQEKFADYRRKKYRGGAIKAGEVAAEFDARRQQTKTRKKIADRISRRRAVERRERRQGDAHDQEFRVRDRRNRNKGHIDKMATDQKKLREGFVKGFPADRVEAFDEQVERLRERMVQDFQDTRGRDPYPTEGARLLYRATQGAIRATRASGSTGP
ncbi:MAG TPA: hypothetical protein VFK11_00385 [Candidatus Saccharimonadales bacterium]|nr:hypothetical protein [Candidatus Saccharimonadales bacterium]